MTEPEVKHCDMCGKKFTEFDIQEGFGIHHRYIGYGSKFDESSIDIDLCCECFDKVMEKYILPNLQKGRDHYIKDMG